MRGRFVAVLATCFLVLLIAPGAQAAVTQAPASLVASQAAFAGVADATDADAAILATGDVPVDPDDGVPPETVEFAPGASFLDRFLQLTVEGIKFGAIIAMTAVGLSLVFGTTRLINFAHGEFVTIGAVTAFFISTSPGNLPLILGALGAMVVVALLAGGIELGIWRPMRARRTGLIQLFIISIGIALALRFLMQAFFGTRRRQYGQGLQTQITLGPIGITPRDLIVVALSFLILLAVAFMLQKTRIGKAARAVSDNSDLARASGIDVDRVILVIWLMGGALAALGGVFLGLTQAIYSDMGFFLLLLMFAGVILGGLGSAYGAMLGSLVIGLVSQWSTLWFPAELQNMWALVVLILVLLFRPQGILGRAERAG